MLLALACVANAVILSRFSPSISTSGLLRSLVCPSRPDLCVYLLLCLFVYAFSLAAVLVSPVNASPPPQLAYLAIAFVPCPSLFYILTVRLTEPMNRQRWILAIQAEQRHRLPGSLLKLLTRCEYHNGREVISFCKINA